MLGWKSDEWTVGCWTVDLENSIKGEVLMRDAAINTALSASSLLNLVVSASDLIPVGIKGGASGSLDVTDGAMIEGSRFESRNLNGRRIQNNLTYVSKQ